MKLETRSKSTEWQIIMLKQPTFELWFPIRFTHPQSTVWSTFHARCGDCEKVLRTKTIQGYATWGHTLNIRLLGAIAICPTCKYINEFIFRLRDDGYLITTRNGKSSCSFIHPSVLGNVLHIVKVKLVHLRQLANMVVGYVFGHGWPTD